MAGKSGHALMLTFGSLFAGIGGLDLGLERAGLTCQWQSETDGPCNGILENHWPDVKRYGDVRECGRHNLEPVDLVCGGFPCQDVSVAGRRKGLAGSKSGLWFEFHRVLAELRPRWVIIENVPGLLSSQGGRDFALILRGLAELGYLSAWRILDAQYFGVAQRRRRVFIVGHLGDARAAQVLFEPTCGPRDTPPSREAGPRVAAPIKASSPSRRAGGSWPIAEEFVVAWDNAQGDPNADEDATAFSVNPQMNQGVAVAFQAKASASQSMNPNPLAPTLDQSKAGGLSVAYNIQQNDGGEHRRKDRPEGGMYVKETHTALTVGTTDRTVVASPLSTRPSQRYSGEDNYVLAYRQRHYERPKCGGKLQEGVAHPVLATESRGGDMTQRIVNRYGVRRLTPVECERLQGFPDNWTAGQSDTKRYKQLGNAVCVPVAEWIGRRIVGL